MDSCSLLYQKEGYELYSVTDSHFPSHTYLLRSPHSQEVLYNPQRVGKPLQDSMEKLSVHMMDVLLQTALKGVKADNVCELVFLSGGLYYALNHGFKQKTNLALPQCFLGIKRKRLLGQDGEFTAVATYENFESLPNHATILIGDTIATGATLEKGIETILNAIHERSFVLDKLVVVTLAGSVDGAKRLQKIEEHIKRQFPSFTLYHIACEQLFHLMPDGTDLRFLYPDAVMPQKTREKTLELYGEELGKDMKCAVFDWGTRCKNPQGHYHEFMEWAKEAQGTAQTQKAKDVLGRMISELESMHETLSKQL